MKPRLIVEQKITAFTNIYKIFGTGPEGAKASLVAFAQQKRIALKEKVTFYNDEQKSQQICSFRAEKVLDVHGRYMVEDDNGQLVGGFKKQFKSSLLNSTWRILDKDGNEIYEVKESNMLLALLRRFAGWIPFVGGLIEMLTLFLKYHFVFIDLATGEEIGKFEKTTLFRDHYMMSMTDEAFSRLDWRVYAAFGVGLDALQSR